MKPSRLSVMQGRLSAGVAAGIVLLAGGAVALTFAIGSSPTRPAAAAHHAAKLAGAGAPKVARGAASPGPAGAHKHTAASTASYHPAGSEVACRQLSPSTAAGAAATSGTIAQLAGVLEIPSIGVIAPVMPGLGDDVLDVAVGHDPLSPWPGSAGVSVLEAHDLSYFAEIDQLRPGALVEWVSGCSVTTFRVDSSLISAPGNYIYPPANGEGLTLITCSPTDALWWTPYRYVVETSFLSRRSSPPHVLVPAQPAPDFTVPAPADLVAEGLTLATNYPGLGTLTLTGTPSAAFRSSPAPLETVHLALESYFGAQRAIAAGDVAWWAAIAAPGLAMPAAWSTAAPLYLRIAVDGRRILGVTITSSYVSFRLSVSGHKLLVASVTDT